MMRRNPLPILVLTSALALPAIAQDRPSTDSTPKPETTKASGASKPEAAKADTDPERAPQRDPRAVTATLRVQLVISRFQNEKKQASLPYSFVVGARQRFDGNRVRMRMGVDTPIPVTKFDEGGEPKSVGSQYRTVGTNIDCWALDQKDGSYQLNLTVENSSALTGVGSSVNGAPVFRRFETFIDPVMRDGQTVQTVASTDPVTAEVVKIDVTINVVK